MFNQCIDLNKYIDERYSSDAIRNTRFQVGRMVRVVKKALI